MAVETVLAGVAAESGAEAAVVEAVEATAVESGAIELRETLSAIEKEVPGEIVNERVDVALQEPTFRNEILEATNQISTINEHLAGSVHPETNVPFIRKEVELNGESRIGVFPNFPESFEARLPENLHKASDYEQAKHLNEQLCQAHENGTLDTEQFADQQLEQVRNGDKPEGYTWHHHEESGRMQLVNTEVHAKTPHTGGRSIWGGGREAR